MPKVFIIILNWNGLKDTLECLGSVYQLDYSDFEVIVVDNCSSDSPSDVIRREFPQVVVIENNENLGYSGGNNAGIRFALAQDADYIWLLNNDTVIEPDALHNLVAEVEKEPDVGIAGSKIYFFDCPNKIWFAGSHINWWRGATNHIGWGEIDLGQYDDVMAMDRVTGCSMLVKREVCTKVGILDENYFLYAEEVDWCVRARKAGFKCIFVPSSIVYHKISVSVSRVGNWNKMFDYYNTRNFLYLIKKSFRFPLREIMLLSLMIVSVRWEKRNLIRAIVSMVVPKLRLEPSMSPQLFAIKDFLLRRMGRVEYKL